MDGPSDLPVPMAKFELAADVEMQRLEVPDGLTETGNRPVEKKEPEKKDWREEGLTPTRSADMKVRLLAALVVAALPLAAAAADEENPYKKVKVGDFATYKMTTKFAGASFEGTMTQTVTAKDDKEVTFKMTVKVERHGHRRWSRRST